MMPPKKDLPPEVLAKQLVSIKERVSQINYVLRHLSETDPQAQELVSERRIYADMAKDIEKFTGLRASELRGLRWEDVDLKRGEIHVRQRADRYGKIGRTKSEAGERTVPLPPLVVSTLREHRLACPNSALGLAFPNSKGSIDHRNSIVERGLHPAQVAAGVVDRHGRAKYKGLHALRHFYASWCINRRVDGGLELPLKVVQSRLGHASIQMTADVYGHLFPRGDDGAELVAAERAFLRG